MSKDAAENDMFKDCLCVLASSFVEHSHLMIEGIKFPDLFSFVLGYGAHEARADEFVDIASNGLFVHLISSSFKIIDEALRVDEIWLRTDNDESLRD